jgi:hypothetical protein
MAVEASPVGIPRALVGDDVPVVPASALDMIYFLPERKYYELTTCP